MTVKELIEKLSEYGDDVNVKVFDSASELDVDPEIDDEIAERGYIVIVP